MPELPEVENVARALRQTLLGRRLDGIKVRYAGALKPTPRAVKKAVLGKDLTEVRRHGKYIFLRFGDAQLMLHLRMTGQVFVDPGYRPDKHVRVVFDFAGLPVYYRDMRKFGGFLLVEDSVRPQAIDHVGPDMLEIPFAEWSRRMAGRRAPLKSLLLHQGIAAGVGNIYADEALFRANVHPLRSPGELEEGALRRLYREVRQVLRLAIRHGGTTYLTFVNFKGKPGNFRQKLKVYGRTGDPCAICDTAIERLKISGRSAHFCPSCQPPPQQAAHPQRGKE